MTGRPKQTTTTRKPHKSGKKRKPAKLSRLHKPEGMSLEDWQVELRRQFGREQQYRIKNIGDHPLFSEFEVVNPESRNAYRVRIRGPRVGDNFCSCPDFATNTLGTCKRIEFTLAALERKRGAAAALRDGYQSALQRGFSPIRRPARGAIPSRRRLPGRAGRRGGAVFGSDGVLKPNAFAHFEEFLCKAGRLEHDLRCRDDVLAFVAEVRDAERRGEKVIEAFPRGSRSAAFKDLLKVDLYDYQRDGALFAARAGRCLIGDEMGLGKTIQALATAEIMARLFGVERALVVCPTSLKHQWRREIERFTASVGEVVGGLRPSRAAEFETESFYKIGQLRHRIRDLDLIAAWSPDLVILDEAQRIKNWNTRTGPASRRSPLPTPSS